MRLLLVSNMYPSKKYPHYGVFVENAEKILRRLPGLTLQKAVMGKQDGKPAKLLAYLWFYAQILGKGLFGGCDVIYGHFLSHIALPLRLVKALRPKVRLILNAHGNDVVADTPADEKWIRLSRKLIPYADGIIVPSAYFKQVMMEDFAVAEEKLFVYPSGGVDRTVFFPQERLALAAEYGLDPDKRYVGYVSRIEPDKGWDTYLHMVEQLAHREELGFLVVGSGSQEEEFDKLAEELGIRDRLIRFPLLSQRQIAQIFNILDVFCFPTRRKSESLGLVGLEAMACGCPVVASDAGGPSSYMRDGENGFLFSREDPRGLTQKVRLALSAPASQTEALRAGMNRTVERYSREALDGVLHGYFAALQNEN